MGYLVYKHTSKTSGKSYIGVTSDSVKSRLTRHLWESVNGSSYHFHRALRAYGKGDFETTTLETNLTEDEAYGKEQLYIREYDTFRTGYNMTTGGDRGPLNKGSKNGMYGKKHTDEAKQQMSEKKKLLIGDKHPHYGKRSPLKGKSYEDIVGDERAGELRNEKRQLHLGRKRPYNEGENNPAKRPEVRAKISAARRHPIVINGVLYTCKMDACEKLNLSRYKLNKLLTAKGRKVQHHYKSLS